MLTKLSVRYLTWQLKKDPDLWRAYKASIAVTIQDNYKRYQPKTIESCLHEFSNVCAEDFLQLWTRIN